MELNQKLLQGFTFISDAYADARQYDKALDVLQDALAHFPEGNEDTKPMREALESRIRDFKYFLQLQADTPPATDKLPETLRDAGTKVLGVEFQEPEMVWIEGGTFVMGNNDKAAPENERPSHKVQLNGFFIGKFQVSLAQFECFVREENYITDSEKDGWSWVWNGREWEKKPNVSWHDNEELKKLADKKRMPAIYISHNDALAYCSWLSIKTGKKYRLPTEAEWEYAARGGKYSRQYLYAGSNDIDRVGWHWGNAGLRLHAMGELHTNEAGLYDVSGNICEWCADWYDKDYYRNSPRDNPKGAASGGTRVLRGGGWYNNAKCCTVTYRMDFHFGKGYNGTGFRVVKESEK